jgi:hypothetical protein
MTTENTGETTTTIAHIREEREAATEAKLEETPEVANEIDS